MRECVCVYLRVFCLSGVCVVYMCACLCLSEWMCGCVFVCVPRACARTLRAVDNQGNDYVGAFRIKRLYIRIERF